VVLCNVLRSLRQGDRRIFGDISRRLFHWSSLMCGSVSNASYRTWIAYCRHSSTSGSPASPERTTRSSCLTTRRCWTTRANSWRTPARRPSARPWPSGRAADAPVCGFRCGPPRASARRG
jgi:hypothetical protein